ncbi:MAG: hypothetical protein JJU06_10470 [Ectothiorhodospiraceae bacterium]|nr:hypothetical protein [Ectothiorhodospiraceae bacterium]
MSSSDTELLLNSGNVALQAGDWAAARDAFQSVLQSVDSPHAMLGLAVASWWLGDMGGTITHLERAYVTGRRQQDPLAAAAAALRLSLYSIAHLANHASASGWLGRARRLVDEFGLTVLQGELLLMQACVAETPEQGEALARKALARGREANNPDLELCALSQLGSHLIRQGLVADGTVLLDEAMAGALGGESTQLDTVVFACCNMIVHCTRCAEFERAIQWLRASDRFAADYGCPFLYAECRGIYGHVLLAIGDWKRAEQELRTALELSRNSVPEFHARAVAGLAQLRLAQGRLEETGRLISGFESHDATVPVQASLQLALDQPALAAGTAQRWLDRGQGDQLLGSQLTEVLGEAELRRGLRTAAYKRGRLLSEQGAALGCRIILGRGERLQGRASADPSSARHHLDTAQALFRRMGMPFEAARAGFALASAVSEAEPAIAIPEARLALCVFQELGASSHADEASSLLRKLGVRAAPTGARPSSVLTRREQQVFLLLGEGISNPEIAQRLRISRKTVEHHVANVLGKLGLKSRAEAAAEAVRGESFPNPH